MIRNIVATSVKRKVTVLMVASAALAFGVVSYSRLALNLLPDISYPSLTVQTEFPNAAPGELENLITRPVEEAVGVLKGLEKVTSVSRAGMSEVTLEFDWGADMDMLSLDIREKLDRLELPEEAERPIVLRYDPALDPIMRLSLSSDKTDLRIMRYLAEEKIKDEFERIVGVAAAQIKGGEEEEIHVNIEQGKLAAMGITPADISRVLSSSNINRPGGSLKSATSNYLVRTLNEYDDVEEIGELTITPSGGPPVYLKDVAEVVRGAKDREEITRVNGQECVLLEIFKEGDANTVQVAREVRERLQNLPIALPQGMSLNVLFDQSRFIEGSIDEVKQALMVGGILAIIILLIFLKDILATFYVALSIPLSVIVTFILMDVLGVSLNIMSLGGLTLGIGMLVDSSIVVLEAIHRQREQGLSRFRAAIEGTVEVGGAVTASILTTIAVFFPIVFVVGIAGQLFRDQSLTVTFSLVASLIVSLSFLPMLSSLARRSDDKKKAVVKKDNTLGWFSQLYEKALRLVLRLRWLTVAAAAGIFFATMQLYPKLKTELIPSLTEGEFFFEVVMPEGTSLPATDVVLKQMEEIAESTEGIGVVYTTVGTRSVSGGLSLQTKDENLGQMNVVMADRGNELLEAETANNLRDAFQEIPNLDAKLGRPSFFSLKTPVEVIFFGEDLNQLKDYTLSLKSKLTEIPGLVDVRASLESGNPELNVVFDRERLARLGLTIRDVSETLHNRVNGTVVSRFKEADRQIDIRLRNQEADRDSVTDIENLVVAHIDGMPITLEAVAAVGSARGPSEIHRIAQSRAAILSGDLKGRGLGAVMADIQVILDQNPPPVGISAEMGGQSEEMEASFKSMAFAIGLAIFLVYLVMAATFENLVHPFIILFTIPFALVGAVLGLYFANLSISIIALIGVIFLVGVVVNNAIVLVDAVNRARHDGMEKLEAVVYASKLRLRPILMTTLTTVLGLLPMAIGFGEGSELRTPLAVVVSTGLFISTALTLAVIPAVYMIVPSSVTTIQEEEELAAEVAEAVRREAHHTAEKTS